MPGLPSQSPEALQAAQAKWVANATVLWSHRRLLVRSTALAFLVSVCIAFLIPKRYEATARIMPPDQGGSGVAALTALTGHSAGLSALGGLAGSLLGAHNTSALFVELLRSGTISGHLIDRFHLQSAYKKRYRVDTSKSLARHTTIVDDKKSGVITLTVEDTNPQRARDLAQGYLDELNQLVTLTNTSSARQERIFIEHRLVSVQADLEKAQLALSDFSSTHTTLDIKEQTRATVDAAAKLQGQVIAGQSELGSLQQIYGDGNVRVRAARARIGSLERELKQISGTDAALPATDDQKSEKDELYPPLRQLPRLAVPYADLYRRVRIQETVFELLTQEYESARIQEAKDTPVISILDLPGLPEKKSYPPRFYIAVGLSTFFFLAACALLLFRDRWLRMNEADPRKMFFRSMLATLRVRRRKKSLGVQVNA